VSEFLIRLPLRCGSLLGTVFLTAAMSLAAREARWQELNTRVLELYRHGRFADAIPLALEAPRESELEMRERVKKRYGEDRPRLWGAFVLVGR